jgi:hypothetical protein
MKIRIVMSAFVLLALAACNNPDGDNPPASTGTATVTIRIPVVAAAAVGPGSLSGSRAVRAKASTAGQQPVIQSYVSSRTRSVTVSVTSVNGAPPAAVVTSTVDVASGSACAVSAGEFTCTISIAAPAGNDGFKVSTFAQSGGLGDAISIGETTVAVPAGGSVNVPVTLLGVVSSVSLVFSPASLPIATAGTFTATISAKDINGDLITGNDNYYRPLTVSTTDVGGHVTASPALPLTLASPAQNAITFTYDGAGASNSYAFRIDGAQTLPANFPFATTQEHLYVAYQFPAAVYVYDIAPNGALTGPSRTIAGANTTLNRPTSIAVDEQGRLYVVNYGEFPSQGHDVAVFASGAAGNVAPVETLLVGQNPYHVSYQAATFLTHPDPADYSTSTVVINYPGPITIAPNGGTTAIPPYIEPFATAFASYQASPTSRGLLCVSSVSSYNNGSGNVQCITSPVLWVTGNLDPGTAQIVNGRARNGFVCCAGGLSDLKFLPDGRLVVSNGPLYMRRASVDTYEIPGDLATGPGIAPVASISGIATNLVSPTSIAYDKQGNLYVGDTGNASYNGSVHVYAPGATGNVSPVRELLGLNYPFGIAIGP